MLTDDDQNALEEARRADERKEAETLFPGSRTLHEMQANGVEAHRRLKETEAMLEFQKSLDVDKLSVKQSNPKDAIGARKIPFSVLPTPVLAEAALGMLEGALKYGRSNYRVIGVRASVYYDATMRHLTSYWEGEDIDPVSGIHHVSKAISSLMVLRDAMIRGMCYDDRPPATLGWVDFYNVKANEIISRYEAVAREPYLAADGVPFQYEVIA